MKPKKNPSPKPVYTGLDLIRCIAAIGVMVGHLRNLFFVDYAQAENTSIFAKFFYFVTGLGHEAVLVFFVLSGLLVGGNVVEKIQQGRWAWGPYLIARFSRLCVVLWPALLLTYAWYSASNYFFNFSTEFTPSEFGTNILTDDFAQLSSLKVYLVNAVFLQNTVTPAVGTNGPLWSLANEFWYYLTFPALLLTLWPGISLKPRILALIGLLISVAVLRKGAMLEGFFIWGMGVGCALLQGKLKTISKPPLITGIGGLLLAGSLVLSRNHTFPDFVPYFIGIGTTILCLGILLGSPSQKIPFGQWVRTVSDFSFTLYLTHLPLLLFIRASLLKEPRWQLGLQSFLIAAGMFTGALIWAYLVYRCTEYYTPQIRQILNRTVGRCLGDAPKSSMGQAA